MMRSAALAILMLALAGCGSTPDAPATAAHKPASGKPLPYAPPPPPLPDEGVACAMDVSQCPDGSFVSRNPAMACDFDPCPVPPPH